MDQDPEMQGANPKQPATPADNHRPAESATSPSPHATTVVETVTTETIKEPKPSEQVSGPTATEVVTETTTKTVGEMPVATEETKPKKKSHKGLIVFIITLLIIIIAAAGAAIWYFVYYSNPDRVAYDAITHFLQQDTVVTSGKIHGRVDLGDNDANITAEIKQKSNGLAGENVLDIRAELLDANGEPITEHDYEVELSAVVLDDGVFYFRTDKLMETVDIMLDDMSLDSDDLDATMIAVYDLFEQVDGEWWQINVPDIIDTVASDSEIARPAKEFYACVINVAKNDVNGQIANVYKNNPFIKVEKAGSDADVNTFEVSTYAASLDYDKMSTFMGAVMETDYLKSTENCFDKFFEGHITFDHTVPTADELKSEFDQIGVIVMDITNFGHELKGLSISYHLDEKKQSEYYVSGRFDFSHPAVTVAAPENYRSVDELIELIVETIMDASGIPQDIIDDNRNLTYDDETDEWYLFDEEVDDTTEEV